MIKKLYLPLVALLVLAFSSCSKMGDWITEFSYAVFDGENMFLEQYIEGETSV